MSLISRKLRHGFFWMALLFMGAIVVETDIIMGHHEADRLHEARLHYVEEPIEEKEDTNELP